MLEEVISTGNDGVVLTIHVQPRARRTGVVGIHGDALKIAVTAAPREGGANRAVVVLLSSLLGVPTRKVTIISGARGRRKRVSIEGVAQSRVVEQLLSALGN